jgi:starch synthase
VLIIKVFYTKRANLCVYFIDNDEYFKRKSNFSDEDVFVPDNDERVIFLAKGAVETVKKLNWVPDSLFMSDGTDVPPVYMNIL